ncbi:phosphodiester glycosidase family protein [Nostoc sp. UHCC 0252]|uniref:phosphodiester glycosidase family protein n=1 Tax=Nostoc sp. UHCC 0252 TaxID=3110241 RepID=UPI002B214BD7|nr:phosphodiester glycosidase family protein [Nostoc sp. UHCC 0252]MEA5605890.1 phosphodiester glycosidase family protein [Nostoc sp. UHCC 0252]
MQWRYIPKTPNYCFIVGTLFLSLPILMYGWGHFRRPPRSEKQQELFRGIVYQRFIESKPRPLIIHIVTIDLNTPGIKPFVTPAIENLSKNIGVGKQAIIDNETKARTTSEFVAEFQVKLAINGSYFYPFKEVTPWHYYPYSGDKTKVLGQTISNGKIYANKKSSWYVLCFDNNNQAQIPGGKECPKNTIQGLAGDDVLVFQGKPKINIYANSSTDKPYSRVVAATDKTGKKLWLVLVDGKQPLYSEGFTKRELIQFIAKLGVYNAINLDGGGSTTLVVANPDKEGKPKILNAPTHTKIPMRDRPVANHLGFYAD